MKKMATGMIMAGLIGLGAYTLMNKNTKQKADKLINNMLDKANTMTSKMKQSNISFFCQIRHYFFIFF